MGAIIVTGGTGFLGRNLIRYLLRDPQYEIYAVVRPHSRNLTQLPQSPKVHIVYSTLDSLEEKWMEFPQNCDAFYHFAWGGVNREEIDDDRVQDTNIQRSLCCVRLAKKLGCAVFVDAGSRMEYGMLEGPFREDSNCVPNTSYGRAKLTFCSLARDLLAGSKTRLVHVRLFSVYGADDHPWSLIYTCVTKMLRNEPIDLGPCTQYWTFMEVEDACDLLVTFYEKRDLIPENEEAVYNVATRDIRVLRDFIEDMRQIIGSTSELRFGTFVQGKGSTFSILPDMSKVERTFGWMPRVSFADGIRKMVRAIGEQA